MVLEIHIDDKALLNAIDKKMDEVADDVFIKSQENIVDHDIIDEGTLLKTGKINREFLSKSVEYPVPYAEDIEDGRLPGKMPPVNSLAGWVKRKLAIKNVKKARSIAFAIARDIKINGTTPRPFLGPAVESVKNSLQR